MSIDDITIWHWVGFNGALVLLFLIDLVVLNRGDRVVGTREAFILTVVWTLFGLGVGLWLWLAFGADPAVLYTTAYIAERALSIDNLFVFIVIFGYFQLPQQYQSRALLFGILGAILARAVFIAVGITIISAISWVLFILGAFLVYTAWKLAFTKDHEVDPSKNLVVRLFRKVMPITDQYAGHQFFSRTKTGALAATPFLLVILALASTDVVFAIDSIPTVLGITDNSFLVWSSNAMAVLGIRPLFFLLDKMVKLFRYLQYALAVILAFIGIKIIVEEALHLAHVELPISNQVQTFIALGVIMGVLGISILLSVLISDKSKNVVSESDSGLEINNTDEDDSPNGS